MSIDLRLLAILDPAVLNGRDPLVAARAAQAGGATAVQLRMKAASAGEMSLLAERLLKGLEQDFSPQESWRLTLAAEGVPNAQQIIWNGEQDGKPVHLKEEPGGGLRRALSKLFYLIMPNIEDLL